MSDQPAVLMPTLENIIRRDRDHLVGKLAKANAKIESDAKAIADRDTRIAQLQEANDCIPEFEAKVADNAKVIAALREAIRWALGEVADDKGQWFGDNRGADAEKARKAPYWWRTNLRRISGIDEQTVGK